MSRSKPEVDPVPLLLELFNLQEQLSQPAPKGGDPRHRSGLEAGRKAQQRRVEEIKDLLVESLQQRALPVVLVGVQPQDEQRFLNAAKKERDVVPADVSAPYRAHVTEMVLECGGQQHGDGSYTMPAKRFQFTAEMRMKGLVAIHQWKEDSYYGQKAFLGSRLHQPAEMRGGPIYFSTPTELVEVWRKLLRVESLDQRVRSIIQPDEYGRCAVLDALRGACAIDRVVENPVVIVHGVTSEDEARGIAGLFKRPAVLVSSVADKKELRKQVEQVLGLAPNNQTKDQKTTTKEKN